MPFEPVSLVNGLTSIDGHGLRTVPGGRWIPVLEHPCDFNSQNFVDVSLDLLLNPNNNSSYLFRADIFYDSQNDELTNTETTPATLQDLKGKYSHPESSFPGHLIQRTLIRQLIPRNPQLDRPIAQTCTFMRSVVAGDDADAEERHVLILTPHAPDIDSLPWYHPAVQSLAYIHTRRTATDASQGTGERFLRSATVSVHYELFPEQTLPLSDRLFRTAHNLLAVLYKHGQGKVTGYQKRVHHDQIVPQKRVQDTYSELKAKHAKRLCSAWVEQTEPSKHVFEDLGIAAFLIELWKDMYASPHTERGTSKTSLPPFPGFVDFGCGNGVLTEVLLLSGYEGHGYDARRRKTWSILSPKAQERLHETLFVPQPLFDINPATPTSPRPKQGLFSRSTRWLNTVKSSLLVENSSLVPPTKNWHNGLFPTGTFIISNHADELTPWTPLLALLSQSPFLAIPCCSHNLSGSRFRAPSAFNSQSADAAAPGFFAAQKNKVKAKSIAITIPLSDGDADTAPDVDEEDINHAENTNTTGCKPGLAVESGDLKSLSPAARKKQPSAYASLCDWIEHLSREVGFVVEREMLRIPSTRNVGLIGRTWRHDEGGDEGGRKGGESGTAGGESGTAGGVKEENGEEERRRAAKVLEIVRREGADGQAWVRRCEDVLAKPDKNIGHGGVIDK